MKPRNLADVPLPPTHYVRTLGPTTVVEGIHHNGMGTLASHPHMASAPASTATASITPAITKPASTTSAGTTPSPLSQNNPLAISHNVNWSEVIPHLPLQFPANISTPQSIEWPPQTITFLRTLIIRHNLFSTPETATDQTKIQRMYREFYDTVAFPIRKPLFEDEKLGSIFKSKISEIQAEMKKSGEVYKTREGYKLSKLPRQNLRVDAPLTEMLISTPPATPEITNDTQSEGLRLWNSLDSYAQMRLFREQLRSAKDSQALIFGWEKYCGEIRRKEGVLENGHVIVKNTTKDKKPEKHQVMTPSESASSSSGTPPPAQAQPQHSKTIDLNSLIEIRRREANLKRQRLKEIEKAKERRATKKPKLEPE